MFLGTSATNKLNVLGKDTQHVVLFVGQTLTLGMNPAFTRATLHHLQLEIVVFVAFLTHRAKVALLTEFEAGDAVWEISYEFADVSRGATLALETTAAN